MTQQQQFKNLIEKTIRDLKTNAFSVEKRYELPADAIRGIIRKKDGQKKEAGTSLNRAKEICDALGLELYIGPSRELSPLIETEVDGEAFAAVKRYDARVAGGGGAFNYDEEPIDHLAFSKNWLDRNGLNAANCILLTVDGHSMEPSINDGDLVMFDRTRRTILKNKIYGFVDGENGARLKRLEILDKTALLLHSNNLDTEKYPTEIRTGKGMDDILSNIIGQVVWSGHRWK